MSESRRTVTVLVPDEAGEHALADQPDVRTIRYNTPDELPTLGAHANVLVPGFRPDATTRALLGQLPCLRLVQLRSAGAERWIDAVPAGVNLGDCRGAHGALTAEWVLAALLALLRDIPAFVRNQDAARWHRQHTADTLIGKRVLLVGAGDVAQRVARRLHGFDVDRITYVGRVPRPDVHSPDELPTLLPDHDVVIAAVPLTPGTIGIVGRGFLAAMPDGAVLVNASRGPVVDTGALIHELRTGRLRAVLDVVNPDPLPAAHPLWSLPGLLVTPHVAGIGTPETWRMRAYSVIREQLDQLARGHDPSNLVRNGY